VGVRRGWGGDRCSTPRWLRPGRPGSAESTHRRHARRRGPWRRRRASSEPRPRTMPCGGPRPAARKRTSSSSSQRSSSPPTPAEAGQPARIRVPPEDGAGAGMADRPPERRGVRGLEERGAGGDRPCSTWPRSAAPSRSRAPPACRPRCWRQAPGPGAGSLHLAWSLCREKKHFNNGPLSPEMGGTAGKGPAEIVACRASWRVVFCDGWLPWASRRATRLESSVLVPPRAEPPRRPPSHPTPVPTRATTSSAGSGPPIHLLAAGRRCSRIAARVTPTLTGSALAGRPRSPLGSLLIAHFSFRPRGYFTNAPDRVSSISPMLPLYSLRATSDHFLLRSNAPVCADLLRGTPSRRHSSTHSRESAAASAAAASGSTFWLIPARR
jgi:hypothetical protein